MLIEPVLAGSQQSPQAAPRRSFRRGLRGTAHGWPCFAGPAIAHICKTAVIACKGLESVHLLRPACISAGGRRWAPLHLRRTHSVLRDQGVAAQLLPTSLAPSSLLCGCCTDGARSQPPKRCYRKITAQMAANWWPWPPGGGDEPLAQPPAPLVLVPGRFALNGVRGPICRDGNAELRWNQASQSSSPSFQASAARCWGCDLPATRGTALAAGSACALRTQASER